MAGYGITDASGPTIKPTFAQAVMVADPVNAMETATKQYVDNMASGIQVKQSAHAATTGNITLSGLQTIDGVLLVAGDRVLVKAQTTASQNGIYIASAGVWSRPSGADTWPELISAFCFVEEGAVNADTGWVCTINAGGTLGSSAIAWTQFAGVGTVSAGTGLSISGNQVSLGTPSTLNGASTNSASGQTHTHAVAAATETVAGVSEMATQEETNGCVDGTRSVTPKTLSGFSMETGSISFVSPGVHTFNVPDVVRLGGKKAKVICTGGSGSGGGGSASSPQSGGGGGAGGTAIRVLSLKGVSTVTVTVGVQGITAANQPTGVNGGASSFGIYLSASGGSGATGPIGNSGGQGGVGQGGDINIYGGWGGDGLVSSLERGSGYGGGSFWGGGGRSSPTQESHPAAFGGGGGGSSAGIGNGNNATGGAVYIEW